MRFLDTLRYLTDEGVTNTIFNQVRNLLYCSFLLAIGASAIRSTTDLSQFGILMWITGIGCIIVGFLLTLLSLADGVYRLSRYRFSVIANSGLLIMYVLVVLRVTYLAVEFRIGSS